MIFCLFLFCFVSFCFSDYPPLSSAQGYRCHAGFWSIFSMSYRFLSLSCPPTVSLSLSFEEQALSISHILFSQGKDIVLCPSPNQTRVCFLSVTFLSPKVITMHHNPKVCSSHSFSKLKKMKFSMDCQLLKMAPFCPSHPTHTHKSSVKRTDNTQRVFLSVCMSTRNWKWHWLGGSWACGVIFLSMLFKFIFAGQSSISLCSRFYHDCPLTAVKWHCAISQCLRP